MSSKPTQPILATMILVMACLAHQVDAADCNVNGIEDTADIEAGVSQDCNGNGVPDACEVVPLLFGISGEPFSFNGQPRLATSGDLDQDDVSDLVVGTANGLHILTGGTRDPATATLFPTFAVVAVQAADLDGDQDLDLVALGEDARIRVFANDGSGELREGFTVVADAGTDQLAVVDVDLDGLSDLLTLNPGQGSVTWHRNRTGVLLGEGFGEERTYTIAEPVTNSGLVRLLLAPADFDGDGDMDLAVAGGREMTVTIFETVLEGDGLEAGEGLEVGERRVSFSATDSLPLGGFAAALEVADVDGNGLADVVVTTRRRTVLVWRRLQEGGFEKTTTLGFDAQSIALSDVDGDATLDLLIGGRDAVGPMIRFLRGSGGGTFGAQQVVRADDVSHAANFFRADDFDADGDTDLATVTRDRARFLLQGEREGLVLGGTSYLSVGPPHFVDVGEFNGDGIPDLVASPFDVFLGRGDGTVVQQPVPAWAGEVARYGVVAIDLNGDGLDDLGFRDEGQGGGGRVAVLMNEGEGEWRRPVYSRSVPSLTMFLAKADVDLDGNVDVLASSCGDKFVGIHFNDGRGTLADALLFEVGHGPWAVAAGDIDSDGDMDVVTATSGGDVSILSQTDEPRSFAPVMNVPVTGDPHGVALGDFDQDGDLDVATSTTGAHDVAILLNGGEGAFDVVARRFPSGMDPFAITAGDLDQDGFLDLITTQHRSQPGGVSVLRGRGNGTFSRAQFFTTGGLGPRHTVVVDLDADGDLDLAVANRHARDVFVFVNEIAPAVPPEEFLAALCTPLDYQTVSVPDSSPSAERRARFLLPARDDPALLPPVFPNLARFPLERNFLREVFPERFAALSEAGYADLALRRGTRAYFAGSVRRLRLDNGEVVYGFDVATDTVGGAVDEAELLSLEETRGLYARLRETFRLTPLVYFPTTPEAREAASAWDAPNLPSIILEEEPPVVEPPAHPTFLLEIPPDMVLCGVFVVAGARRGPREELEFKTVARLRGGTVTLPTENETFPADLFAEVVFGPEQLVAEPEEGGTFGVRRIAPPRAGPDRNAPVTTYRFTYSQTFRLADGRLLEVQVVSPLVFEARGEEPLKATQTLPEDYFVALKGREPLQARLDGEPLVRFGSCTYESLPLWSIEAELEDGTAIRLQERYEEAESLLDTAPASLVSAAVTLGGETRVVTDYYDLVYSASRHNTRVDYWVLLEPPVALDGVGEVHVLEFEAPESLTEFTREASAAYLGADLEVLASPQVIGFERAPLGEALFLRGDASGDGALNLLDALAALRFLFEGTGELPCPKAADANDDGRISIVDPIVLVAALFGGNGGDALPEPFPDCGGDPTEDALTCRSALPCP